MNFIFFGRKNEADKKLYKNLKALLGFNPKNLQYYKNAFRHSSAGLSVDGYDNNNERLEFVGDAIISAIISDILYEKFPKANEGKLSILRSTIVNRTSLNNIAFQLKLGDLLIYRQTRNSAMKNMGGNTLEALVGAIYFDRGYKYCEKFVGKIVETFFDLNKLMKQNADYKSKLLQFAQKHKLNIELNTFENIEANEKLQHFHCEICLDKIFLSEGKGWSKKEAEQIGSKAALVVLRNKASEK
jgi:ribonuclease-3